MAISARSTPASAARRSRVGDIDLGRGFEARADAALLRSISSAPVTTRRTARTFRHFSASASSRQSPGISGNCRRCTESFSPGKRFSHASSMVKQSIGASQAVSAPNTMSSTVERRAARRAVVRIAIERVLADVEIEGGEIVDAEIEQRMEDALEVEGVVAGAHDRHRARRAAPAYSARAPACR